MYLMLPVIYHTSYSVYLIHEITETLNYSSLGLHALMMKVSLSPKKIVCSTKL